MLILRYVPHHRWLALSADADSHNGLVLCHVSDGLVRHSAHSLVREQKGEYLSAQREAVTQTVGVDEVL
jgi:hypothetical protein